MVHARVFWVFAAALWPCLYAMVQGVEFYIDADNAHCLQSSYPPAMPQYFLDRNATKTFFVAKLNFHIQSVDSYLFTISGFGTSGAYVKRLDPTCSGVATVQIDPLDSYTVNVFAYLNGHEIAADTLSVSANSISFLKQELSIASYNALFAVKESTAKVHVDAFYFTNINELCGNPTRIDVDDGTIRNSVYHGSVALLFSDPDNQQVLHPVAVQSNGVSGVQTVICSPNSVKALVVVHPECLLCANTTLSVVYQDPTRGNAQSTIKFVLSNSTTQHLSSSDFFVIGLVIAITCLVVVLVSCIFCRRLRGCFNCCSKDNHWERHRMEHEENAIHDHMTHELAQDTSSGEEVDAESDGQNAEMHTVDLHQP